MPVACICILTKLYILYLFSQYRRRTQSKQGTGCLKEEIEKTKSEIKAAEHEDEKSQLEELASVLSGTDTRTDDLTYETEDSDQLIANEACGILDCFNCFLANDNDEKEKERGPSDEETSFPLI